ncbi:hypothetical protein BVRB_5g107840 [Beta vulgaris subsp. vulgaris]|nr:hypothetical protein BVRB_5g107840 [Beta vulgaris subsp. vulgaris]
MTELLSAIGSSSPLKNDYPGNDTPKIRERQTLSSRTLPWNLLHD